MTHYAMVSPSGSLSQRACPVRLKCAATAWRSGQQVSGSSGREHCGEPGLMAQAVGLSGVWFVHLL